MLSAVAANETFSSLPAQLNCGLNMKINGWRETVAQSCGGRVARSSQREGGNRTGLFNLQYCRFSIMCCFLEFAPTSEQSMTGTAHHAV